MPAGAGRPTKLDRDQRALDRGSRSRHVSVPDLGHARTEAAKITSAARRKVMLDVIDALDHMQRKRGLERDQQLALAEREKRVASIEGRIVLDSDGREWAFPRQIQNGTIVVDESGSRFKYSAGENYLQRFTD